MPTRFYRQCRERGCFERTNDASGFCAKHQKDNYATRARAAYDSDRKKDPVWRLYNSVAWTKRFRPAFEASNPTCQRIENERVCGRPMEMLHHLLSPRVRPDLFFAWTNIVSVCRQHHPVTAGENPENLGEKLAEVYAPTVIPSWMRPKAGAVEGT